MNDFRQAQLHYRRMLAGFRGYPVYAVQFSGAIGWRELVAMKKARESIRISLDAGFTLIELMIVVVIIGVLATLAFPLLTPHLCAGRLSDAQGHLLQIASKMRMYKIDRGTYYSVAGSTLPEDELKTNLGVDLSTTGNFCFVTICRHATLCSPQSTPGVIAAAETGDSPIEFEVWAILRNNGTSIGGPNGVTCTTATGKVTPTGWVKPTSTNDRCRQGRVVVHRYPPPPNGLDTVTGANSVNFDWLEGTSISHPMTP